MSDGHRRGVVDVATIQIEIGEAALCQEEEEEEEWMDVEDLRAGMRVRFMVQSLGAYEEHDWVNISRILVEEQDDSDDSDNSDDATTVPLGSA